MPGAIFNEASVKYIVSVLNSLKQCPGHGKLSPSCHQLIEANVKQCKNCSKYSSKKKASLKKSTPLADITNVASMVTGGASTCNDDDDDDYPFEEVTSEEEEYLDDSLDDPDYEPPSKKTSPLPLKSSSSSSSSSTADTSLSALLTEIQSQPVKTSTSQCSIIKYEIFVSKNTNGDGAQSK